MTLETGQQKCKSAIKLLKTNIYLQITTYTTARQHKYSSNPQ